MIFKNIIRPEPINKKPVEIPLTSTEKNLLRVMKEYKGFAVFMKSGNDLRVRVLDQNRNPVKTYPKGTETKLLKRGLLKRVGKEIHLA